MPLLKATREIVLAVVTIAVMACRPEPVDTTAEEWREVMAAKRKAMHADLSARQAYADRVLKFLHRHPDHARARVVYEDLQLAFARELTARGDHAVALRYYDDLLSRRPKDAGLLAERAAVADLQSVQKEELAGVTPGMSDRQVERILGRPRNGWERELRSGGAQYRTWLYPNDQGGIAAVHFARGKVFAIDYATSLH